MEEILEAVGGERGGAGGPSGERVVVRLEGPCLEVFHETGSHRFHARLVDSVALAEHPSGTGSALEVQAARQGIRIPVRFVGEELTTLDRIIAQVRRRAG